MGNKQFTILNCSIDKSSFEKLNSQFAKVKIRIAYAGRNRNRTSLSKELLQHMAETSLKNIPIVGEWKEENNNFGGHGGKLEISDDGIKFIDTTKPYGVVPTDTEIWWEPVKEKDGYTTREYLCCTGILWVGRYEECEKILDDGSNQSMEILVNKGFYDEDDYYVIEDAEFSALCVLGKDSDKSKNVEPCFEQASIQSYSVDSFKAEFTSMLNEYKNFKLSQNNDQMEVNCMDKVIEALSALTFKCGETDKKKYEVLSVTETEANVVDREDNYKVFSIPYTIAEDETITFNYDAKVEKSLDVKDKVENDFSIKSEIDIVSAETVQIALATFESNAIANLTSKYDDLNKKYQDLEKDYLDCKEKLSVFESEKLKAEQELHKKEIDDLVESYASKMETYPDFLLYRSKIDYSKTKEQVNTDLLILLGKANMGQKATFSFNPVITGVNQNVSYESTNGEGRYGDLFDRIKK